MLQSYCPSSMTDRMLCVCWGRLPRLINVLLVLVYLLDDASFFPETVEQKWLDSLWCTVRFISLVGNVFYFFGKNNRSKRGSEEKWSGLKDEIEWNLKLCCDSAVILPHFSPFFIRGRKKARSRDDKRQKRESTLSALLCLSNHHQQLPHEFSCEETVCVMFKVWSPYRVVHSWFRQRIEV